MNVHQPLKQCKKNNKSPGSVKSLNYSFESEDMTVMQKQGLISLLPKKNKKE